VSDSASPALFRQAATSGRRFPTVKVEMRKAGGDPQQYTTYVFTNVLISKFEMGGAGDRGPEESITFVYGGVEVHYSNQAASGPTAPPAAKVVQPPSRAPAPPR
jgi:type VI protein secretion system component Hcp